MIEAARQLVPQFLTVEAINAQLDLLNTRCGAAVPKLGPTKGVQNMWAKTFSALERPGIGYEIGFLHESQVALKTQGYNEMTLPLAVMFQSSVSDVEGAHQQVALYERAVLYALEAMESKALGWTPDAWCVLIAPVHVEVVMIDAGTAGKLLGFRARYDLTFDDLRS